MTLRCKQGDLAIILAGGEVPPETVGMEVTCLEYLGDIKMRNALTNKLCIARKAWRVESPGLTSLLGLTEIAVSDEILLPIRPEPDPLAVEDECKMSLTSGTDGS